MTNSPTRYETRLNYVTVALLAVLFVGTLYSVLTLPDRIPVHFNLSGEADRWGSTNTMLILPFLCLLIEGLLWATRWAPSELMNFPGPRTPANVARQVQNIMQLTATMQAVMAALFLGIVSQWAWAAVQTKPRLTLWIPLVLVSLLLVTTGIFMVRAYRLASPG